jgi:hypothetical protein
MVISWILIRGYFQLMENININILVLVFEEIKLEPSCEAPSLPFMLLEMFLLKYHLSPY